MVSMSAAHSSGNHSASDCSVKIWNQFPPIFLGPPLTILILQPNGRNNKGHDIQLMHETCSLMMKKLTWQWFVCIRFCSRASLVPPITTWTPREGWYFNRVLASAAAWLASSLVGQIIRTTIGGRFSSRPTGGDFKRISIDGSWNQELQKLESSQASISDNWYSEKYIHIHHI